MKIIDSGIINNTERDSGIKSANFSEICVLTTGRWLCSYRLGANKTSRIGERLVVTWSDDEGSTWADPVTVSGNLFVNGRYGGFRYMGLTPIGKGVVLGSLCWTEHTYLDDMPLVNPENQGALLENTMLVTISEDEGETWSLPYAPVLDKTHKGPKGFSSSSLYLDSGEIMWTYESGKRYFDEAPFKHKVVSMFSNDLGGSWEKESVVVTDQNRYYWDHRENVMEDGKVLMFFWTYDIPNKTYLNIHAVESEDNGMSWSKPWDTRVFVQPARPLSLKDGKVALVYVDRKNSPTIKVILSDDGGKNFDEETDFTVFDSTLKKQLRDKRSFSDTVNEFGSYSVGLPRTALLDNGDILISYYTGLEPDITDVVWKRIKI